MYTRRLPILYPEACASGGSPPVGTDPLPQVSRYPRRDAVPFGFCSGGFSSTSSLRSGQRGSTEVERRSLPGGRSFPLGRRRVFIRAARTNLPIHPAQAFRLRRERQCQQLNRRLLSSSTASPRCLPISSPVSVPVRTATGGGLYAGAWGVSRLFFENFFRPVSAGFSAFRAIQKVHPQPISTGGNFMREAWKNSSPRLNSKRAKNLSRDSRCLQTTTRRAAGSGAGNLCVRACRVYSRAGGAALLKSESRLQMPDPTEAM
jgi:hypothetical protein